MNIMSICYHCTDYEAEQIRCGEHTDYGTMTLLMQDESGGLEVCQCYKVE